jgi:hypothetical protein
MKIKALLGCIALLMSTRVFGVVTNEFGVCYHPDLKIFDLTFKEERRLFEKTTLNLHNEAKTLTARNLRRINRHFYRAEVETTTHPAKETILFRFQPVNPSRKRYGTLFLHKKEAYDKTVAVDEYLIAPSETIGQEVLYANGKRFNFHPGLYSTFGLYSLGHQRYLFWQKLPFTEYSPNHYFLADREKGTVTQLPLLLVFDVWNNHAFASCSNKDESELCFYNLATGQRKKVPNALFDECLLIYIVMLREDEIILWTHTEEEAPIVCRVLDGNFREKKIDYTYERHRNILIQYDATHGTRLLNQSGETLWDFKHPLTPIEKIDLDVGAQHLLLNGPCYEALLYAMPNQMVLVDCLNEKIYTADQIEHVGLGFFKITTAGTESWITL